MRVQLPVPGQLPNTKNRTTSAKIKLKNKPDKYEMYGKVQGGADDHAEGMLSVHEQYFGTAGMFHRFDVASCSHIPEFDACRTHAG